MYVKRFSLLSLALSLPAYALSPGDEVALDAIAKSEFIQGTAPETWEHGKLYVVECWATWCGPCIAAIPHVDGLYDKYHDKGLEVIGMNVWDANKEKVVGFVEKKGEGMSYPVAYAVKGGSFDESWLKAAGVRGIPYAFLVKDGKLLFGSHPASLTAETVEALLAGGDTEKAVMDKVAAAAAQKADLDEKLTAFSKAQKASDGDAMAAALAEVEKVKPDYSGLSRMTIDLAMVKKDWEGVAKALESTGGGKAGMIAALMVSGKTDESADEPPATVLEVMAKALSVPEAESPMIKAALARVLWKLGRRDEAVATAKSAVESPGRMPTKPIEAFAASLATDKPQTLKELSVSLRAGMKRE